MVVHDFLPETVAGTELLVARLAAALAPETPVAVFCTVRNPGLPQNHLEFDTVRGIPVFKMVQNYPYRALRDTIRDPAAERVFVRVVQAFRPHVVHFHHLAFLPLTLPIVAASRGLPVVFTLHDYYLECPSCGRLSDHPDGAWCTAPAPERCAACYARHRHREGGVEQIALTLGSLPGLPAGWPFRVFRRLPRRLQRALRRINLPVKSDEASEPVGDVLARRAIVAKLIDAVDLVIAPSRFIAEWARRLGRRGRLEVVPNPGPSHARRTPLHPLRPLRCVYVGTLAPHKGLLPIVQSVSRYGPQQVRLEIWGDPDVFPSYTATLRRAAGENVLFRGFCPPEAVCDTLARNHVLVMGSTWPENAPLTILEAHACGRPVVAPRVGGVPEYVRDGIDGLLFDPGQAEALDQVIDQLVVDPDLVRHMADKVTPPPDPAAYAARMKRLYREVVTGDRARP